MVSRGAAVTGAPLTGAARDDPSHARRAARQQLPDAFESYTQTNALNMSLLGQLWPVYTDKRFKYELTRATLVCIETNDSNMS